LADLTPLLKDGWTELADKEHYKVRKYVVVHGKVKVAVDVVERGEWLKAGSDLFASIYLAWDNESASLVARLFNSEHAPPMAITLHNAMLYGQGDPVDCFTLRKEICPNAQVENSEVDTPDGRFRAKLVARQRENRVRCISVWQLFALGPVAFAEPDIVPKKKRKSKGPAKPKGKASKRNGSGKKGKYQVLEEESDSDSEEHEFDDGAGAGSDDQDNSEEDDELVLQETFENPREWGLVEESASSQEKADNRLARKIFRQSASFGSSRPTEALVNRANITDRPRRAGTGIYYASM
jgi:hypothetical protein